MRRFLALWLIAGLALVAPAALAQTMKHRFVSAKPDVSDTSITRPSNWNDSLVVDGGSNGQAFMGLLEATVAALRRNEVSR